MKKLFLTTLFMFVASTAYAVDTIRYAFTGTQLKLSGAALSGAPAFTTTADSNSGLGLIVLQVEYTRVGGSAVTAVNMACFGTIDSSPTVPTSSIETCTTTVGNCVSNSATWSKAVGATSSWLWRVDGQGYNTARCVFTTTGAAGTDSVTIKQHFTAF